MGLRLRRGTNAQRLFITPAEGELIYTTDTKLIYVGDGVTLGGNLVTGSGGSGIGDLIDDTSPQLGGNLDLNSFDINGTGNIDLSGNITSSGTILANVNLLASGSIGVGTPTPVEALDVIGNAYISGSCEATQFLGELAGNLIAIDSSVIVNWLTSDINANIINGDEVSANLITTPDLQATSASIDFLSVNTLNANTFAGNFSGSIYSDNSTVMIDGITGSIVGPLIGQILSEQKAIITSEANTSGSGGGGNLIFRGYKTDIEAPEQPDDFGIQGIEFEFYDGIDYVVKAALNAYNRTSGAGYIALTAANTSGDTFFNGIEIDGESGIVYFFADTSFNFENTINANSGIVGDITGSVFADDSTLLVDGINGILNLSIHSLGDLGDVDLTGAVVGNVLKYDGSNWVAQADLSGSNAASISNTTQANPVVVTTSSNHNFFEGQLVTITDVVGMTQLNGNDYYADVLSSTTFALYSDNALTVPVNGTGYTAYVSGGDAVGGASTNALTLNNQNGAYYLNWNNFTNTPTTIAGYGITDAVKQGETLVGDLVGSVFADNSTLLVDGVNGIIPKINIEDHSNWDTAYGWGDHASAGYVVTSALGTFTFTGSVLDTNDSSVITVTPATIFSSDVTIQNDLIVTNKIIAETIEVQNIITNASGTPEIASDTDIILSAGTRVEVSSSPFKLASFTTAQRDALSAQNGDMIYNTDANKFQGYAGGTWVNLH